MSKFLTLVTRCLIFFLLIFGPLARGSVQGWAVTLIHMITVIALASFLLEKEINGECKWIKTPLDMPVIALMILSVLAGVFSLHRPTSFWAVMLLVNYIVIYYLVIHTSGTRERLRHLVYVVIGTAVFLSAFGMVKLSGANPFPCWDYKDIRQTKIALSSTFGSYNNLAGYMEMALPLLLGLFITGIRGLKLMLMTGVTLLLSLALILSLSRGGWIGAFAGLLFMAVALFCDTHFHSKKIIIILVAGFFLGVCIVLSSTPVVEKIVTFEEMENITNLQGRIRVWEGIGRMISDYPLLGTGPGTFATIFTQYQPAGSNTRYFYGHNDYLHFISETGLVLVPIMIWMIIAVYRRGFIKMKSKSRLTRGITVGSMAGITAILVHSMSDFNLHIPANAMLFTVLSALVVMPEPEHSDTKSHSKRYQGDDANTDRI